VPGSPYENIEGALTAIRYARENGVPFLGTCGGFQHAVIEFARNVLGICAADHAESNPGGESLIIGKLTCPLVNQSEMINFVNGGKVKAIYKTNEASEAYQCSYGLNPVFQEKLRAGGLRFSAFGSGGEARAFELPEHPFFVGTLFQPERSALRGEAHPLIREFLRVAAEVK
jgi:CTP synthase (UTP-ammonia lyase)